MSLGKVTCLVICLCKLQNFCVEERLARVDGSSIIPPTAQDSIENAAGGGIGYDKNQDGPEEFLGGGHHNHDTTVAQRMAFTRRRLGNEILPRDKMHDQVCAGGFQRPTPRTWQTGG